MKHIFLKIKNFFNKNGYQVATVFLFGLALFLHGYNMFAYPYYESDEGTYMSQAWSVESTGELTPYTYWYDHPPFGWYVLGAWVDLIGGDWNTFGNSLNTGRAFMLVLHLVQLWLVVYLAKKITGSRWLALLAGLLFTISPVTVYFQRRILLDNIMVTWLLISTALLHRPKMNLSSVLSSGLVFGFAVVTKVTSVMFGPPLLWKVVTSHWPIKKNFRIFGWLAISGSVLSLWFIYALIKTEFFPNSGRVSLIGSTQYQASRGTEVPFWHPASSFVDNLGSWMLLDKLYVYFLGICVLSAIFLACASRKYRFIALSTLFYFYFLIRGGVVIGFYILPLVPFAVITAVSLIKWLEENSLIIRWPHWVKVLFVGLPLLVVLVGYYPKHIPKYLTKNETRNQVAAIRWVKENLPKNAAIMTDVYALTELHNPDYVNDKVFDNADWYFKIALDPEIRFEKYKNDWRNLDYVFLSHEMIYQSEVNDLPVVRDAIRNSRPLIKWTEGSTAYLDIQDFRSTNGDWAAIYKINGTTETQLQFAWNYYKQNFIFDYGQVIDPDTRNTTSEGQAYAMLRAVVMADEDAFDGIWLWTQDHLQHRVQDNLLSWQWRDGKQVDSNPAIDADLDAALALIFAGKIFDNPAYYEDAQDLLDAIWEQSVVSVRGNYYLLATEKKSATRGDWYLVNPSYFSPGHYRIFAEFDKKTDHKWLALAEDTYSVLNRLRIQGGANPGLPPNWIMVNANNGVLESASRYASSGGGADAFGFDAFRVFWRVGLDAEWFGSDAAITYLDRYTAFWEREWSRRGRFSAIYGLSGISQVSYSSSAVEAGIISGLKFSGDPELVSEMYDTRFTQQFTVDDELEIAYWGDGDANYYTNNWSWLGLALFNGNLPNLWKEGALK